MTSVSFATFCYSGDAEMLHQPGQLEFQINSNDYPFDDIVIVYQNCNPDDYIVDYSKKIKKVTITDKEFDPLLEAFGIDTNRQQYISDTDKLHTWKNHVVNHLRASAVVAGDYIVFADADCWIKEQRASWVKKGIDILENNSSIFIVSPNDGEAERTTRTMSQQMFLVRKTDWLSADFNQPGWHGDVRKHPEMPEYHGMIEGRIHHYCKHINKWRYVLGPDYRYWHSNKICTDDTGQKYFEKDYSKW